MNRLFYVILFTLLITPILRAQTLAAGDLTAGVNYLEKTRQGVLAATTNLSEAQWNFKQGTNRWSVAEVVEHIAAAEDLFMSMIRVKVMKAPARTEAEDLKALDQLVLQKVPDRSVKAQAPEPLKPSNRFGSPQASLKHFQESRARTVAFLKTTRDLRLHAGDSPLGKKLDAYEWLLFIAAHSERHTRQIEEVKADPNFPKR